MSTDIYDIFIHYMKLIATKHPLILHEDEEGKIAFVVDDLMDLLDGVFKDGLKAEGFSIRCGEPIIRPQSDEASGLLANIDCGFSVLKACEAFTSSKIYQAQKECSSIVKQIIAKMVFDSRNGHSLFDGSLNKIEYGKFSIEKVTFKGDGTWSGLLVTFSFQSPYIDDIFTEVQQTNWLP